ncbi:zinc finger CCHC domain-containing protein 8 isoform X2 [Oryzias latipes]|uniref:zinc finger CCHC domain-containing protein 8 isoform X2 n=1 Tax=Oryzias latipes TaxID=8090 RepID=UPI0005CB9C08|nr:zinc finger CCHC domain-containing protein 8 isoform X2 [Oryzias latipes]
MAEVDFGDSELFEQLDDNAPCLPQHIHFTDNDEDVQTTQLRSRLEECEDTIERLTEENKMLRRKLNILTRPSGITVEDVNIDGPLLQILYTNNIISKQCRQEIEDCVCKMISKHQIPGNEKSSLYHTKPQNSAFSLEEDPQKSSASSVKTTTEAFKVVGSVLYFTSFSVDKLGQPIVNDNPQLTDGWDVPTYQQVFNQVIGTDGLEIEMKDKRSKSMCFNCGSSAHQLRDCPKPKDFAAISERRKEFNQSNNQAMQTNQRYHADEVEERFAKYKPGVMSEELLSALGIDNNSLPPLIYRMRQLGYPPGWLKEAEMENSGLSLYDGNVSAETSGKDQILSYDVSKLVDFPGFNVPAPHRMRDEFKQYGSIPMQNVHMKTNYAAYLSNSFPVPDATCNKRQQQFDSSPQQRKKRKSSPNRTLDSSDMDIESDPEEPYHHPGDFQFQTPLPPGSPCFSTPPPLPQGTPPATPTPPPLPKGTPPPTPTNGSPALRGKKWTAREGTEEGMEDELTLEELEEQQRIIWAALENADTATNSDCETPAFGTPAPNSPNVSTPSHTATETGEVEVAVGPPGATESSHSSEFEDEPGVQKISTQKLESIKSENAGPESPEPLKSRADSPQGPGPVKSQEDSPQSPGPVKSQEDSLQSPGPVKSQEDSPQSPGPVKSQEDSPQSPGPVKSQEDSPQSPDPALTPMEDGASAKHVEKVAKVPHRSKFASGIVPFEDTPEFTELAEATGTYLKIRDLLKSSPRSLIKKK